MFVEESSGTKPAWQMQIVLVGGFVQSTPDKGKNEVLSLSMKTGILVVWRKGVSFQIKVQRFF